jgi:cytochrome c oxidase assembly protein subunit 15
MKLQPAIVTAHLLGGVGLLALLVWLALREGAARRIAPAAAALRWPAALALVVLIVQIALGGWVSTNYAVMACPDFPLCQGRWVPEMDFRHGFTVWRDLGRTGGGELIPFQALVAVHWTHRVFAYLVFALLGWLAWRAWRLEGVARLARTLAALLVLQFVTGLSNVVLQWPLLLAVLHNGGAAALVGVLVTLNYRVQRASVQTVTAAAIAPAAARASG